METLIQAIGIMAARFFTYFEKRGRHEIMSFFQSVVGFLGFFILIPDNQTIINRITNGDLSKEAIYSLIGAMFITFIKASCYSATGKKNLIRTPDKD